MLWFTRKVNKFDTCLKVRIIKSEVLLLINYVASDETVFKNLNKIFLFYRFYLRNRYYLFVYAKLIYTCWYVSLYI